MWKYLRLESHIPHVIGPMAYDLLATGFDIKENDSQKLIIL